MNKVTDYQPIACGLHSLYEWVAQHQSIVRLTWLSEGKAVTNKVKVLDVAAMDGAEYLWVEQASETSRIRLDYILEMDPMDNQQLIHLQRQYDQIK